ncbi:tRNA1(Val) (adenine(37)-N6)-methyltransferase [Dendrosporobacter sp. 1207_IL3150]|uniref:tRNA1(Val) (adenine(37)-N6)-methyltransferase n=1 Tax=Dendrosporobacter sp. 1207_IL3150 TaxID=3084054 RepID=UPI002FDA009E
MNKEILNPGERLDDLIINNMKIIQHEDEFRFSLDAVLLAHFATLKHGSAVIDLGTGTGIIGLLLAARGAGFVTGIEINQRVAEMASRSVALNGLSQKMDVINADLCNVKGYLSQGKYDLVVSNPPYRPVGGGLINPSGSLAIARHEVKASLDDIIAAARHLVKYRGRFAMIHLPERMAEILKKMSNADLEPKRLQVIYPKADSKPTMVLVEGIRGAKAGLEVLPPFIIYKDDGSYSDAVMAYYK